MANPTIGRYARIIMDDWFKRSFGVEGRERLLELFLKELIPERSIRKLTYVSQEHVNPFPENKSVRIDVECTDEDGTRFMVEMQVAPQHGFHDRAVFNSTFAIQQQLAKGVDDYSFPTVYFIGLMDYSFHKGSDQVLYRYNLREVSSNELMTPEASVLDNICYALHNMENLSDRPEDLKEEIFKLLFESAEIAKFPPEEKVKYENNMRTDRDIRNQIAFAKDEGLAIGRQEGRQEGREEGRQEGREEGMHAQAVQTAQWLLERGMPAQTVAEGTGLTVDEVLELGPLRKEQA